MDVTFTQDDLDKAVADAVGPLKAELEDLRQLKADIEKDEVTKSLQEKVDAAESSAAELQKKLDDVTIEANDHKTKYEEILAWLEEEASEAERRAEIEKIREERAEAVRALKVFPETYIEENAERFAAMSEDDFKASMADWKAVAEAKEKEEENGGSEDPPKTTAFAATRDDSGNGSVMSDVLRLREQGIDPRRIRNSRA